MQLLFIFTTLIVAVFFEWSVHGTLFGFSFPLIAAVTMYWFWNLQLGKRIMYGFGVGFLMDAVSPFLFGIHMAVFLFLAVVADILRNFFSDTSSYAARTLGIGILFFCFIVLVPIASAMSHFFATTV